MQCRMSETKRVTLTPISASKKDQKKVKEVSNSFRFKLTLSESNDCTYPEFNYRELLNSQEEKLISNGLDSFPDDDDEDVKRIAREMEAKYGQGPPKKKKKRFNNSYDYADVGAGYDESDSFIDNTDAYDEVVPPEMSTLYGGFYINCGRLEFKQQELSETEEPDESLRATGKNRKRILDSDSDEDSDGDNKGKGAVSEKKPRLDSDTEKSKKKQEDLTALLSKKKKTLTVKDLLREKRIDCINTNGEEVKVDVKPSVTNHTSVNDVIESVINSTVENIDESSKESGTTTTTITSVETITSSDEKDEKKDKKDVVSVTLNNSDIPKLPEKLPDELKNMLETIKKSFSSPEGKKKFFSDSVNNSLIKLEYQCRLLGNNIRNQVYTHIAAFVNCKKETLIRRIKKLLLEDDKSKLNSSLKRLKDCINMVMPVLLENYVQECQRVNEKRLAQDTSEMINGEKPKSMRLPKRRFQWTEDSRQILGEIIVIRRKMDRTRKERFETCVEEFYKKEVVNLWPEGWISVNSLMRETQPFLEASEKKINSENKKLLSATESPVLKTNSTTNSTTNNSLNDKKSEVTVSITNKMVENVSLPSQTKVSSKNSVKSENNSNPTKIENSSTISIDDPVKEDSSLKMENGSSVKIDDSVSLIKKINNSNSSLTIEPIPLSVHKVDTSDSKEKSNKNENKLDADSSIKIPSGSAVSVKKSNSKGNSRNNSPVPNAPIDLNIKSQNHKISVRNITELSDLSKVVEKSVVNNEKKNQQLNDSDIEIIEIKDDVVIPLKEKRNNKIDLTESDKLDKVRTKHKKKHKPPSGGKVDVEELAMHDVFSQIITKQLAKSGYAQKKNPDDVQKPGKPENDVEQVMKDLQELHELSGSSRDKDGEKTSQPSSSPVSVIAINSNKYSTVKCKSEVAGFQDAFQKHLLQEVKDCNSTKVSTNKSNSTSSSSTTQQKVKFANNSNEIFPFLGNLTTLPVSTSQRFPQVITLNSNVTEQHQSQPGAASKNIDDVILFPNFIYEFGLNKLKGPERKSPPH